MNAQEKDFDQYLKDTITIAKCSTSGSCIDDTYSIVNGKMKRFIEKESLENRKIVRVALAGLILILLLNFSFIILKENPAGTGSSATNVASDTHLTEELSPFYMDNYLATLYE